MMTALKTIRRLFPLSKIATQLSLLLAVGCGTSAPPEQPKSPEVTGTALALPPVGKTLPVFIYLTRSDGVATYLRPEGIVGMTPDGSMVRTIDADQAAEAAGGSDKLLATVSDESELHRLALTAAGGVASIPAAALQGALQGMGSGTGLEIIAMPVVGAALGAAIGIVAATVKTAYYAASPDARRMAIIRSVSLGSDQTGPANQGFVYFPASNLSSLRIAVFDPRYGLPFTVRTPVVSASP